MPHKQAAEVHDMKAKSPIGQEGMPLDQGGDARCRVVGLGASAGGLGAFEAFFAGFPADTPSGMAFVLIQHLSPDHESLLVELVRRSTTMPVLEVKDGLEVLPDHVYIIPPGCEIVLSGGLLKLLEPTGPRGLRLPIDRFFQSLALELGDQAMAVVLSGNGRDGTEGIRAVKASGGFVLVQEPSSAAFDGMPRSALAAGVEDARMTPGEMSASLLCHVAAPPEGRHREERRTQVALSKVFLLLRTRTGHDFSQYKPSTVHRRLERRMAVHQVQDLETYVGFLQQTPEEVEALFRDLLIGVTHFFRDPEAFRALETQVLPALFRDRGSDDPIRVWVPGCSTGEEAYSIAMLLQEQAEAQRQGIGIQVFATDMDDRAIRLARAGIYPASALSGVSPARLARCFSLDPDGKVYRVRKGLRDLLVFSEQDVIKDPPFSRLDLISCRNLMIYMGADLQRRLIPLFHYALNSGGYLFLGTSETVGTFGNLFAVVDRTQKLYRREGEAIRLVRPGPMPPAKVPAMHPAGPPSRREPSRVMPDLRMMTEAALLDQLAPVGVLVNGRGDIHYLHGRSGQFLEPAPGEAGVNNLLRMAREGLHADLAIGLREAQATETCVVRRGLRMEGGGGSVVFDLTIRPMPPAEAGQPLFLVVLEARGPAAPPEATAPAGGGGDREARIEGLTRELRAKEAYLQAANEELEASNEELRSSNEELQSVNEELQSTNEELETSKEELQSVNEELATVNAELQAKVLDLSQVNNDMNNLLAGTGIGTVFVDHRLRILRFTPAATRIINLIPGDVGRPVGHLVSNLEGYDRMVEDVQEVLDTLVPRETEVRSREGGTYAMRIQPYRTLENIIEGAVLTFVDISREKRVQAALMESERRFRVLLDQAPMAALVVREGRIQFLNHAGCDLFGFTDVGEAVGRPVETFLVRCPDVDGQGGGRCEAIHRDGRRTQVDVQGAGVPFPDGEAQMLFMSVRNEQGS